LPTSGIGTTGIGNNWNQPQLVSATTGIGHNWYRQQLVSATTGISNIWYQQHLVQATTGIGNNRSFSSFFFFVRSPIVLHSKPQAAVC
jgi:fumarate reductase subunit C